MHRLVIALITALLATTAYAGIEDAHSAYDRGNYAKAMSLYREYADQGSAEAQYSLGTMYYDGKGVAQDYKQAALWIGKAAAKGLADAQMFMGSLYFDGKGVKQDYEEAVKWYLRAADNGNVDAQYNMGCMYENGFGVPLDCDKAQEWYEKAAMQGDTEAQEILQYFSCRDYANVAKSEAGGVVISPGTTSGAVPKALRKPVAAASAGRLAGAHALPACSGAHIDDRQVGVFACQG